MKELRSDLLDKNLKSLGKISPEIAQEIRSSYIEAELVQTPSGQPSLKIGSTLLHSSREPVTEVMRQLDSLKKGDEDRVFLFFGSGLGYSVQYALGFDKVVCVWMEPFPGMIKLAFSLHDYSGELENDRLRIVLSPFDEASLYAGLKGVSGLPVSFIPHRGSLQWNAVAYQEPRFLAETYFHKKDVNTATLTRFEKVWTGNFLRNLPELLHLHPIRSLFELCQSKIDIIVCGAGPSLSHSLSDLKRFRESFILIAVDTALLILQKAGIDPDLVFSVDPQSLNSKYLEGYTGDSAFVFDPTTSYHSLRLPSVAKGGFFTSSPFPWIKLIELNLDGGIGSLDFGGSVSTNATSLAEKMGARSLLLLGQDLSFPGTLAHCKGAILEERLNFLERRKFRREFHNHKQMTALPAKWVESETGKSLRTNEKLLIFKKWFEERKKEIPWRNLSSEGARLESIPFIGISDWFNQNPVDLKFVQDIRNSIKRIRNSKPLLRSMDLLEDLKRISIELREFLKEVQRGEDLSRKIYTLIGDGGRERDSIQSSLREIARVDELVASKKGLTEFLGTSLQRVILSITEGYETDLTLEEKKNEQLAIAKKSVLLYEGLRSATQLNIRLLGKSIFRIQATRKY
ncbi:PF01973 family protein [Leptospira broomii serovar Hurstbridge str. 5399]|uniref:PF01973 family protein n=1 Tax=Leptospira broomii serovar Hurstbridge str. 5399 TaxID=1049789 RepID=T0FAR1_9LEPT|nr:6-hydroxymethylpterin diphosphokinase MptE-like protein [Leptospira broomii]EQA44622.1 PF01973 family protein [Leptospira broomii serovar Hurstbridge str. 5399]